MDSWKRNSLHGLTLLMLCLRAVSGATQESTYVMECIRDITPFQIYNECCVREHNCTVTREQNRGIDCISRLIKSNYTSYNSEYRDTSSSTTETTSYSYNKYLQRSGDSTEMIADNCSRHEPRVGMETCIRNELIKRCRYSMYQDRKTGQPNRFYAQRYNPSEGTWTDGSGTQNGNRRRNQMYGGVIRREPDGFLILSRPREYDSSESRYGSRRSSYEDDDEDGEFSYSDGIDSFRYR